MTRKAFTFLIALSALSAGLALAPAIAAPVCDASWRDASRNRSIPVRIRLPDGSAKVPLILFSHGLGGSLSAGTMWAEAWAQAGFGVIHLQHRGSDTAAVLTTGLRAASGPEQLRQRVTDVKFVLDTVRVKQREGECDLSRLDLSRIGMSGHSFGAHTTQALAGQRFPTLDRSARDQRIIAAIAFSPTSPAGTDDVQATSDVTIPFFSITGTQDAFPFQPHIPISDRERAFAAMPSGKKYLLVLDGADHMAFNGNDTGFRRKVTSPHIQQAVISASIDFWRAYLKGDDQALQALDSPTGLQAVLKRGDRLVRK